MPTLSDEAFCPAIEDSMDVYSGKSRILNQKLNQELKKTNVTDKQPQNMQCWVAWARNKS